MSEGKSKIKEGGHVGLDFMTFSSKHLWTSIPAKPDVLLQHERRFPYE